MLPIISIQSTCSFLNGIDVSLHVYDLDNVTVFKVLIRFIPNCNVRMSIDETPPVPVFLNQY